MAITDEIVEQYTDMVRRVASDFNRRYPMVDRDDIAQECWLWFVEHPNKTEEWMAMESVKESDSLFARSLRNAALRYCVKEKAKIEGYHVDDIFWYSKAFIKELLPAVMSNDWRRIQQRLSGGTSGGRPVSQGGDWMAYAADIRKAYSKLNKEEQDLVYLFYAQDMTGEDLKETLKEDRSARASMMKANRAVGKMVKFLGGNRPLPPERDSEKENGTDI